MQPHTLTAPARAVEGRTWCGPYTIAALAGCSYEFAYYACLAAASDRRGRDLREVKGMTVGEIVDALAAVMGDGCAYGSSFGGAPTGDLPTLRQWATHFADNRQTFLVQVTGHVLAYSGGHVACSRQPGKWLRMGKDRIKGTRSRVRQFWLIEYP